MHIGMPLAGDSRWRFQSTPLQPLLLGKGIPRQDLCLRGPSGSKLSVFLKLLREGGRGDFKL